MAGNFDINNQNDRTVLNWNLKSTIIQARINEFGFTYGLIDRNDEVDVVSRILFATYGAEAAGRITTAQRDAVLTAWNNSFGTIPGAAPAADLLEAVRLTASQLDIAITAGQAQAQYNAWQSAWT